MKQLLIAPIAFTILASSAGAATLIPGSGITATASSSNHITSTSYGPPQSVVDGTGLDSMTGIHSTANGGQWYTSNGNDTMGVNQAWISFDLGTAFVLESIRVWNASSITSFGIATLDIYVSAVATPGDPEVAGAGNGANWSKIGTNVTFPLAPASNTGFDLVTQTMISLPTTAVRHVRFEVNTAGANFAGLSEVQFSAVPEPSAALLGGLGALLLLRRRRH